MLDICYYVSDTKEIMLRIWQKNLGWKPKQAGIIIYEQIM